MFCAAAAVCGMPLAQVRRFMEVILSCPVFQVLSAPEAGVVALNDTMLQPPPYCQPQDLALVRSSDTLHGWSLP